jgi:hypothetical protein
LFHIWNSRRVEGKGGRFGEEDVMSEKTFIVQHNSKIEISYKHEMRSED